jgi:hypothetical protein
MKSPEPNCGKCEDLMEAFERNSSELYWLAFLLTGNVDKSVEAFAKALDFDEKTSPVLCESPNEWARKLTVIEALRGTQKELRASIARVGRVAGAEVPSNLKWVRCPRIEREQFQEAVIAIDPFPRCAMLLTIFEGMSIDAVATLLHADQGLTRKAQQIGIVRLAANLASGRIPVPVLSLG